MREPKYDADWMRLSIDRGHESIRFQKRDVLLYCSEEWVTESVSE